MNTRRSSTGEATGRFQRAARAAFRSLVFTVLIAAISGIVFFNPDGYADEHAVLAAPIALSGHVSSSTEGAMEGVLVSLKKDGSGITTTVVSDTQGRYSFSRSRIGAGQYSIRIKATGYDLDSSKSVTVPAGSVATADIRLRKTGNLSAQLSNAEWLVSFPGTAEQKSSIQACTHCHTLEPIVTSTHDAVAFEEVLERMSHYSPESFPLMIQPPAPGRVGGGELNTDQQAQQHDTRRKQSEYLAKLNLSSGDTWTYPLKSLARPTGRSTRVVVTEFDLPEETRQPHDVIVDSDGFAWYASFGEPILGRLNPKTGAVKEWTLPVLKPGHVVGNLDIEFDEDQNIWIAMTFQAAVAKFDRKTEKFTIYKLPPELDAEYRELTFVAAQHSKVDGKVWINDSGTYTQLRLDVKTGKFETFEIFKAPRPNTYDVLSDSENNAWVLVMGREHVARIDAKTGKTETYQTPTAHSAPRRGMVDSSNRVWFGENRSNKIGMFDPASKKFQEWESPVPQYFRYDVTADKNGDAWADTEYSDSVLRLTPTTGKITEYVLPRSTNMRRAFVDNATNPPTFWVGNTHGASIVKVEPLD